MQNQSDNDFYVYLHKRGDTGEIFYVGKGKKKRAWHKRHYNPYWMRVAEKHGFTIDLRFNGLSETCAFSIEKALILSLRRSGVGLVNLTDGGEGPSGRVTTDETKLKQRAVKLGRKLTPEHSAKISISNTGKKLSDTHREALRNKSFSLAHRKALSAASIGRKHTPETIEKIRLLKTGLRPSPETLAKRSLAASGEKNPHHSPQLHNFWHPTHGHKICTQYELRSVYGLPHGNLSKVVSGSRSVVGGWKLQPI